jgi:glycosyltransferase involved in cell wall biosynthesis
VQRNLNKLSKPLVSVILPVYNGEVYLQEAISSILTQTYTNLEFIIINDGSTDRSSSIVRSFEDKRIRFYEQTNQGIANSLNFAITVAQGKYIARQDADDVSMPRRIEKQVAFMELHHDYGMVGTWAEIWKEGKKANRSLNHPSLDKVLRFELVFDSYFVHSSVMIRKSVFHKVGYYNPDICRQPEDFELWSRVARDYKVANIPESLHVYREVKGSLCRTGVNPFKDRVINICSENLAFYSKNKFSDKFYKNVAALSHGASYKLEEVPNFLLIYEMLQNIATNIGESNEIVCSMRKRLLEMVSHYYYNKYGIRGRIIFVFYTIYLRCLVF